MKESNAIEVGLASPERRIHPATVRREMLNSDVNTRRTIHRLGMTGKTGAVVSEPAVPAVRPSGSAQWRYTPVPRRLAGRFSNGGGRSPLRVLPVLPCAGTVMAQLAQSPPAVRTARAST